MIRKKLKFPIVLITILISFNLLSGQNNNLTSVGKIQYGPCNALFTIGDTVLFGYGDYLNIFNMKDPQNFIEISKLKLDHPLRTMDVEDNYLYILESNTLRIIDIEDLTRPEIIGSLQLSEEIIYPILKIKKNIVYVLGYNSNLNIIDVSSKEKPKEICSYDGGKQLEAMFIYNDELYLSYWISGLKILNIKDPKNPKEIGSYAYKRIEDIYVQEDYAFLVSNSYSKMIILDVSDPSQPEKIYERNKFVGYGARIIISKNHVFMVDEDGDLEILDITDKNNPIFKSYSYVGYTDIRDISLSGDKIYLASGTYGILILDCSDRSNPEYLSRFDVGYGGNNFFISGNYAYLEDREGFNIVDISNPGKSCFGKRLPGG